MNGARVIPFHPIGPGGTEWRETTVAVCTRDRRPALLRALRSVHEQTLVPGEILVVDNGSPAERVRQAVEAEFPSVRYVQVRSPGLDFARNAALRAATGEIVVFLDDDAVADREWLEAFRARFAADHTLAACTGRVRPLSLDPIGARIFEANGGFPGGDRSVTLPNDAQAGRLHGRRAPLIAWVVSFGSGCNLAVRRETALDIGGFDEALDLGAALPAGGDSDLLWRLLQAGHSTGYEPAAVVRHEHRITAAGAYDQIVGHQRGFMAFLGKSAAAARGLSALPVFAYAAWRLIKPGVRLARWTIGRDPLPAGVLVRLARAAWTGLFAYPGARRIAARRRRAQPAPETTAIAG